jgi:hypothetical protein
MASAFISGSRQGDDRLATIRSSRPALTRFEVAGSFEPAPALRFQTEPTPRSRFSVRVPSVPKRLIAPEPLGGGSCMRQGRACHDSGAADQQPTVA